MEKIATQKNELMPDICYSTLQSTGELIMILRGEHGYFKSFQSTDNREDNERIAEKKNLELHVSSQQKAAMIGGSMFGWNTPAAQLSSYDENGTPIKPERKAQNKDNYIR